MTDYTKSCPICTALDVTLVGGSCPNKPNLRDEKWTCDRKPHWTGWLYMQAWNRGIALTSDGGAGGIARISDE
jgi:hypothetical protein